MKNTEINGFDKTTKRPTLSRSEMTVLSRPAFRKTRVLAINREITGLGLKQGELNTEMSLIPGKITRKCH